MSPVPLLHNLLRREDNAGCEGSACHGVPGLSIGVIIAIAIIVFACLAAIGGFVAWISIRRARATKASRERYMRDYYYRHDHVKRSQMEESVFTTTQVGTDFGVETKNHDIYAIPQSPTTSERSTELPHPPAAHVKQ